MRRSGPPPRSVSSIVMFSLAVLFLSVAQAHGSGGQADNSRCIMGTRDHPIKHVVYLQFDNVHLRRDNPNVPSDLEQMPNLLNFLEQQGTLLTNHHTPLISHTAVDIVTSLTGVYGEKFGFSIGNSFGIFQNGVASFPSSFAYWTDVTADGLPQMVDRRGKTHPAPWVPFTRAGCDVGGFSIANLEFENVTSDINNVFGPNSPQAAEAKSNRNKAIADFEGIIVHCAQSSPLCAKNGAPDVLEDEPGGYHGFSALYGNANVQPRISPTGPVKDLDGNIIADSHGNPGFPGFDPLASQSLGYVATMLEAGVQVVYFYISDAHDNESPSASGVSESAETTFGPGEQGYVNQLAAYDTAFGKFFARLARDGITKDNTLFVVTADENDHFVGGPPSPANCDGIHSACTYAKKGEVDADLSLVLATEFGDTTPFGIHFDDAPTFYINGNPGQMDAVTRKLEQESGRMLGFDPVAGPNGSTNHVTQAIADQAEQNLLHMITFDPNRTPNFILFANPDYFLQAFGDKTPLCTPLTNAASCFQEESGFAWNHGDFQNQITHTWLGIVGPGVQRRGRFGDLFTDHTDIRPTIMSLTRLKDDYVHDGRTVFEILNRDALPDAIEDSEGLLSRLAEAYKQINAPRGLLGRKTLTGIATRAAESSSDVVYAALDQKINTLTARRNEIAGEMLEILEGAEFGGAHVVPWRAEQLIFQAGQLLASVD
jgi:hypothetical protein